MTKEKLFAFIARNPLPLTLLLCATLTAAALSVYITRSESRRAIADAAPLYEFTYSFIENGDVHVTKFVGHDGTLQNVNTENGNEIRFTPFSETADVSFVESTNGAHGARVLKLGLRMGGFHKAALGYSFDDLKKKFRKTKESRL